MYLDVINKIILGVCTIALLQSCNSRTDTTPQPIPQPQPGVLSARIDGQVYTSGQTNATAQGQVTLSAYRGTEELTLVFYPSSQVTGTYNLNSSPSSYVGLLHFGSPARDYLSYQCSPAGGFIQITEYDAANNTISGNFQTNACATDGTRKQIAQGAFTKIHIQ